MRYRSNRNLTHGAFRALMLLGLWIITVSALQAQNNSKSTLEFKLNPSGATVEVDEVPWRVENGIARDMVFPGEHTYRVAAPGYHTMSGKVSIDHQGQSKIVDINLLPSTGILKIGGGPDAAGADIYIDGILQNIGPDGMAVEGGIHTIKVNKDFYELYEDEFTVVEGETIIIEPVMVTDSPKINVTVPDDAEIWLLGRFLGRGAWSGPMRAGEYTFEAKKAGHRTTSKKIEVEDNTARDVSLDPPAPIYGSLKVTSIPPNATITVDGETLGQTPLDINQILIGNHTVEVSLDGYRAKTLNAIVERDRLTEIIGDLRPTTEVNIVTNPANATLKLNGEVLHVGTPYLYDGPIDDFHMEISAPNYRTQHKNVHLGDSPELYYKLSRQYVKRYDLYLEGGYTFGSFSGLYAGLGCNLNGYNMEVNYYNVSQSSETIYWNYTGSGIGVYNDACTYKPSLIIGFKIGGSILAGTRVKITPQAGWRFTRFSEESTGAQHIDGMYCGSVTLGIRVFCAICPYVGISFTPEYAISAVKSDGFKLLQDVSSFFDKYANGFNAKAAITIYL